MKVYVIGVRLLIPCVSPRLLQNVVPLESHVSVHLLRVMQTYCSPQSPCCFAPSQTSQLSTVEWSSRAFLPWWWWWCSRQAADPGGHSQKHSRAEAQEGGGDGRCWD